MAIAQQELVLAVQELEPLAPTSARLASLLSRPDWSMSEVEEAVSLDQALTAKLIRLANSALWFRGHSIVTVREAAMRLGSGTVIGLAMGAGVQRRLSRPLPQYGLGEGELWTHSVAAALATSVLDAKTDVAVPVESFASALLHDVGKLVMARYLDGDRLHRIEEVRRAENLSRNECEIAVLGLDHAELGGVVGVHWHLPEQLVAGIVHHHDPTGTHEPIASVVHVADALAHRAQALTVGVLGGERPEPPCFEALDRLGLATADLDEIAHAVADQLSDVLRRFA